MSLNDVEILKDFLEEAVAEVNEEIESMPKKVQIQESRNGEN